MLPGGQYAIGQAPGRSEVTVSSLRRRLILYCKGQLFCFVGFLSASVQTRQMWVVRQGSSLTWMTIRIRLQGRKPGESNKLFDHFYHHRILIRPIRYSPFYSIKSCFPLIISTPLTQLLIRSIFSKQTLIDILLHATA